MSSYLAGVEVPVHVVSDVLMVVIDRWLAPEINFLPGSNGIWVKRIERLASVAPSRGQIHEQLH